MIFLLSYVEMKTKFSIQQLIEEATKHEQIASQYRSIAASLNGLNPNVELILSPVRANESLPVKAVVEPVRVIPRPDPRTKLEAVIWVLKNSNPKPLNKSDIMDILKVQGQTITLDTLSSYLSRNNGKIFINPSQGLWKLKDPDSALERDDPT
jgi:hypothetical protein